MDNIENIEISAVAEEEKDIAGESKADKFKRLGASRVNKALIAISRLENLSGSSYEYTEDQVDAMFEALYSALDSTKSKFKKVKKETATFTF